MFLALLLSSLLIITNLGGAIGKDTKQEERDYWAVVVIVFGKFAPLIEKKSSSLVDILLLSENWKSDHIKLLVGKNATKRNILDALNWLYEKAGEGDRVLFAYAGYGWAEVNDENGDEPDGKDEALITYEALKELLGGEITPDMVVTDDELGEELDKIESRGIDGLCVILDCSLAGGIAPASKEGDQEEANEFTKEFVRDISKSAKPLDVGGGKGRVIIMSTLGNNFGTFIPLKGSFLTMLLYAFYGGGIFYKRADADHDKWISAEEAFKWARKRWCTSLLNTYLVTPFLYHFVINYLSYRSLLKAVELTIISMLFHICYLFFIYEVLQKIIMGHVLLPIPTMVDNYDGELELVNLSTPLLYRD